MKVRVSSPGTPNLTRIVIDDSIVLWFSYETMIGLESRDGRWMTDAKFGPTTARHKKVIDATPIPDAEFQAMLTHYGFR